MARTFDALDGRIGRVKVSGVRYTADLAAVTTKASVDMSTTQTTQLTLELVETPTFDLLRRGLFSPGTPTTAGSRVDVGPLRLEVRALEIAPVGDVHRVTVTARTYGIGQLKRRRGASVRTNLSPTTWLALEAKAAGLTFIGEPSPKRPTITRDKTESSWDTGTRLGSELGYLLFELAGVLYFGRPTWLVDKRPKVPLAWKGASSDGGVLGLPTCRRSGDDPKAAATVETSLTFDAAARILPGHALILSGVPTFDGRYLVDSVRLDLGEDQPATVSASTPINPTPQPPADPSGSSGSVGTPKAGRYGGRTFNAGQLAIATTIYRVAKSRGMGDRGAVAGIATGIVESGLRNLKYGDRDSVGVFQQRGPWGSFATRTNVEKSAGLFYDALKKVRGWEKLPVGVACQRVQVSAFPGRYAQELDSAEAILAAIKATASRPTSSGGGTGSSGKRWGSPVPNHPKVTYPFGVRNSGYAAGYHTGQDYGSGGVAGDAIKAILSGVARKGPGGPYGNSVILAADNGHEYLFAHMSRRGKLGRVQAGDTLGYVGATGNTTGPHLHLEMSSGARWAYGRVQKPTW